MRLLARTAVWTAASALLLLAGCGAQPVSEADDSQSVELRSPQVASADHHDVSAPLSLIRPAPPSLEKKEHPGKPVPRRCNHGADRFLWATDYPHSDHDGGYMAELHALAERLPPSDRAMLLGENAANVYGL